MAYLRLKKQVIKVIDKQIKANDPPCTKKTFLQLQEQGCSKVHSRYKKIRIQEFVKNSETLDYT